MAAVYELRLWTRVARQYYESNLNQLEPAERMGLSQATVSRPRKQAREEATVPV